MKEIPFKPANILLPKKDFEKWAVIACDQYTSEPAYWDRVFKTIGDAPSAGRLILPEAYLSNNNDAAIDNANLAMENYLQNHVFTEHENALIYHERTQRDGRIKRGLIGMIDLEEYDFHKGAKTLIRSTEETILDRIPPRVKIRKHASLEIPHIILLIDDPSKTVIEPFAGQTETMKSVYDFTLMEGGGHAKGYLINDNEGVKQTLSELLAQSDNGFLFAVGDGNHSLATAKACYEANPNPYNRYALVEIVNIHSEALDFEPIYRVLFNANYDELKAAFESEFTHDPNGQQITVWHGQKQETLTVKAASFLPVGTLQTFLDRYLAAHADITIDYVHGLETVKELCEEQHCIGFTFDGMEKSELFPAVAADGALPRKTFSMGHAWDKRYYIEARKIK
ncbi:MAG: DUF1015 domain-containing protein [Clostridiales bacterium]|nr:DUF1015 domain-containing protein [Clostridiales bacterium]